MRYPGVMLITIAATMVALITAIAGTANATPTDTLPRHSTSISADGATITTVLTDATFRPTTRGLEVIDALGRPVDVVAERLTLNHTAVNLRTTVSADGRTATFHPNLTPQILAAIAPGVHPASAKKERELQDVIWHLANGLNRAGTVSAAIGAGVGAVIGGLVGLVAGCAVVAGCIWLGAAGIVVGAAVGAAVGGVAGVAYGDPRVGQAILDWINTP